ncbi:MAG: tRNA pseudouridine(13) synthase TruD [Gammaproteobacteria bacterium]|nr:tRNA pseudouridine(13) synthase TruD [Gammaproteobacteria bacterium]
MPEGKDLQLQFSLPAGCYATSVLRELVNSRD